MALTISRIVNTSFSYEVPDMGPEERRGFDTVYRPGHRMTSLGGILTVETREGVRADVPGGIDARTARYLLGRDALQRDEIWQDLKRGGRGAHNHNTANGYADLACWVLAANAFGVPLYRLLGGSPRPLPCYASTYHADENGGLTTPKQFAEFAVQCRDEWGYPAFKIHGWVHGPIEREIETLLTVREAVGDRMALMTDPAGAVRTFDDALRIGRACDDARYFWIEDPFRGGGMSGFAAAKLKGLIRTPVLLGEHILGFEAKADAIVAGATDYCRASIWEDGGITGVMKMAALAEAFGLDLELHGPSLAHRHIMASIHNTNWYELGLVHPNVRGDRPGIYADPRWRDGLENVVDGCVDVPSGPGLGAELDWDWIRAHQTGTVVYE